ncbi:MAG TPA: nicotinate (nicotinamide) nucleotide adenylyltransferase [Verrucomicrobiae bacterium]|nr:nicotinate (nicotinamide) nucleotide adenylyltransferase [Verrucomicrobiae bacterium]
MRIGVLGCTADPIQNDHLRMAGWTAEAFQLDQMLIMVAATPPHKMGVGRSAEDRFRMAELAVVGYPHLAVSRLELDHPGEPYTYQTVDRLHAAYGPDTQVFWVIGSDWVATMHQVWREYEYLLSRIKLVVMGRPGYGLAAPQVPAGTIVRTLAPTDIPVPPNDEAQVYLVPQQVEHDLSSTLIRTRLAQGESIEGLTPGPVVSYIHEHGLYKEAF